MPANGLKPTLLSVTARGIGFEFLFFYFSFSGFDFFTKGISPKLPRCTGFLKITLLIPLFLIQHPSALAGNWLE